MHMLVDQWEATEADAYLMDTVQMSMADSRTGKLLSLGNIKF